jgi:hypothetical protein
MTEGQEEPMGSEPAPVDQEFPGGEPTPVRDNGPYAGIAQVRQQVRNVTFGMPPGFDLPVMLMREALMICGVDLSEFEEEFVQHAGLLLTAEQAQVMAGWLIRSHLAGRERAAGRQARPAR